LVLAVLCTAMLMLTTDATIVTIANPSIQEAFRLSSATLQWNVTAYGITFGGFLLLGGRLCDLYGGRRVFLVGVVGFTVASMGAGTSQSMTQLIAFRAAQGLGAAMVAPATLALVTSSYPEPTERQRALAIWATSGAIGGVLGFVLGGVITSQLGWRWIFFVNGPAGALAFIGGLRLLTPGRRAGAGRRLDLPGAVSVTAGLALLIYGLGEGVTAGWAAPSTVAAFVLGACCLLAFGWIEARVRRPLLPLALLRSRAFGADSTNGLLTAAGIGAQFLSALYLQQVYGYSPQRAGLATLPIPLGYALGASVGTRLHRRFGPRLPVVTAGLLVVLALVRLTSLPDRGAYALTMLPAMFLIGFGLGVSRVPAVVVATSGIEPDHKGVAAGLFTMCQQMGMAVGVAVLGTVAALASQSAGASPLTAEAHGVRVACGVGIGIAMAATVMAWWLLPSEPPAESEEPETAERWSNQPEPSEVVVAPPRFAVGAGAEGPAVPVEARGGG
jgi:EmrB/QacA subfamily drug resistance transporter